MAKPPAAIPQEVFAQGHSVKRGALVSGGKVQEMTAATFNLSCPVVVRETVQHPNIQFAVVMEKTIKT